MEDLLERRVVVRDDVTIYYADVEMYRYRKGPAMTTDKRREITNIGLGDPDAFEQMFPK
jgi:hypothetical protein